MVRWTQTAATSPRSLRIPDQPPHFFVHFLDLEMDHGATVTPSSTRALTWHPGVWGKGLYQTHAFERGIALFFHDGIDDECRVIRYGLDGTFLSDLVLPCWDREGYLQLFDVSPDGRMIAMATFGFTRWGEHQAPYVSVISIFDATTGVELLRIKGASQPLEQWNLSDIWLADSSGVVVGTSLGDRIVTLNGRWESGPGRPAPDDPAVFANGTTVRDREGRVLASLEFGPSRREIRGLRGTRTSWGSTASELRVHTGIYYERGHTEMPSLDPVIEQPPFDDHLIVEVVVDTCLNLREEPSLDAPILTCLANGTVAGVPETHPYADWSRWMHLRTDDGLEGWASAEYLRWHSDGVRLEE